MPKLDAKPNNRALDKALQSLKNGSCKVESSNVSLQEFYEKHPNAVPDRIHPHVRSVLQSLIAPKPEKPNAKYPVRVFGAETLLPIANRIAQDKGAASLNIGMSGTGVVSPMMPSYVELGLQRLRALQEHSSQVKLRVFSTASLSPKLNEADPAEVQEIQKRQHELLSAYIQAFHADLASFVDIADIQQDIEFLEEGDLERRIDHIQAVVGAEILSALEQCGQHHGGAAGARNALAYAAYHSVGQCFQDEGDADNIVSIGGPGEELFNQVRFGASNQPEKHNVGLVLTGDIVSRTPPYLAREGNVSMEEFVQGDSDIMKVFLANPNKKNRRFVQGARELLHIAKCIEPSNPKEGLQKLRDFYRSHA